MGKNPAGTGFRKSDIALIRSQPLGCPPAWQPRETGARTRAHGSAPTNRGTARGAQAHAAGALLSSRQQFWMAQTTSWFRRRTHTTRGMSEIIPRTGGPPWRRKARAGSRSHHHSRHDAPRANTRCPPLQRTAQTGRGEGRRPEQPAKRGSLSSTRISMRAGVRSSCCEEKDGEPFGQERTRDMPGAGW